MTLLFWLIAAFAVLVALIIVMTPILRTKTSQDDDLDQRNIAIARERLAELKANLAAGGISQSHYDEQVFELEQGLSEDLDLSMPSTTGQKSGRWLAWVLAVAIPVTALSLYALLGDRQALDSANDPRQNGAMAQSTPAAPSAEAIASMVSNLAEKLKTDPDNLEGWMMLGRSYKVLQRYPEAVDAFYHALKLAGGNADIKLAYAEAMALASKENWAGQPLALINEVLSKEPQNPGALWFAAMANAQQGNKSASFDYLKKLETVLPENSAERQQIHDIIANSQGQVAPSDNRQDDANDQMTVSVSAEVSLADAIKQQTQPDDVVFIYAQAPTGPKMPLALVKKRVADLPVSVTLTDADSMMPAAKLSQFKQVRLLARVSKSGNAMPQSGDLLGKVEEAATSQNQQYQIVINESIP